MKYKTLTNPEDKIIEAANKVFLKYGVEAATMMQIADEAGISRTSLHYYYRSKAHLFETVFEMIECKMVPKLSDILEARVSVIEKIQLFVNEYIDLITEYPGIPGFMSAEIQRNPEWIIRLYKCKELDFDGLKADIRKESEAGRLRPVKTEDLFANIMGMCVFPILTKPVFKELAFDGKEDQFVEYMSSRKREVMVVIKAWLTPETISIN